MPFIRYINKKPQASTIELIDLTNIIINEYKEMGFALTLRQIYYQFVSRDWISNSKRSYDRLGTAINTGRLCGLIDWDAINDNLRELESVPHWKDPQEIILACAKQFRLDKWADQKFRPEIWVEKDALSSIVESVCTRMDVPYLVCRGYASQSAVWQSGQRMIEHIIKGQIPIVFHFGDHDPSGIDMTRDNHERLTMFTEGRGFQFRRIALNFDQVQTYKPPPNPAKQTDSRFKTYRKQHGEKSWELDALDPKVLVNLIMKAITSVRNDRKWRIQVKREEKFRTELSLAGENWKDAIKFLEKENKK